MKTTLVTVAELACHPEWRLFDCRHDLSMPDQGSLLYSESHIKGALHAHLDRALSAPKTGFNGRHPLPEPAQFATWLGKQGVRPEDQVIAYDDGNGMFAARLWWMLSWLGHRAVAVLDGGFAKWRAEGHPVTEALPSFPATVYPDRADATRVVNATEIASNLINREFLLVDARAANRYEGKDVTIDPRAGHIPGALNRPFSLNLDTTGLFKPAETLSREFTALLGDVTPERVVSQCGSGVTACHNLLALEIAGMSGARLYPGSWSEWCSDPARPVATGPMP